MVNFYKHHIGDYATATAHLSWDEDMAYRRLLQVYYQHEKPIPLDKRAIYRLVRAQTKAQREAVDVVLAEFFDPQDDGWHNERADEEVERYQAQADTNRAIAKKRWKSKRSTGSVRTDNDSHNESSTNRTRTDDLTTNQEPDKAKAVSSERIDPLPAESPPAHPTDAGRACRQMRTAGCAQTNPAHPDLLAALAEGVTPDALAATAAEAVEAGKAKPFAWAIATARSRHAEGAKPIATGPPRQTQAPAKSRTLQALEVLERMKTHDPVDETGNPDRPAETRHALAGPYSRA